MSACYYPDGSASAPSFQCWKTGANSTRAHSACCFNDTYCFSGGWCLQPIDMTVFRAGCTDRSWNSDDCVKRCTDGGKAPIGGIYKCDDAGNVACFLSDCGTSAQFKLGQQSLLATGPAVSSVVSNPDQQPSSVSRTYTVISPTGTADTTGTTGTSSTSVRRYSVSEVVGIVLGVSIPVLIAALVAVWLLVRMKRKLRVSTEQSPTRMRFAGKGELSTNPGAASSVRCPPAHVTSIQNTYMVSPQAKASQGQTISEVPAQAYRRHELL